MACQAELELCLQDTSTITCLSCDEAIALRCIALAKIKELTCSCMSAPVEIGTTRYASPLEAISQLRQVVKMTFDVCMAAGEEEGPVMETIWQDRCKTAPSCPSCNPFEEFHEQSYHS